MIRLISIIVVFVVFLCFIVFNLPNRCDVSFGFTAIKDVPIFLSVLSSFVLGMLVTVPMILFGKKKQKPLLPGPSKKAELKSVPDNIKKEDSPYGID
jgi:uncharacterized membrane protein